MDFPILDWTLSLAWTWNLGLSTQYLYGKLKNKPIPSYMVESDLSILCYLVRSGLAWAVTPAPALESLLRGRGFSETRVTPECKKEGLLVILNCEQ